jgi:hypothetical protein
MWDFARWKEQNEGTRDIVRKLVNEGRLEFISDGWCMNDEATTHYADIIDQMSLGLKYINNSPLNELLVVKVIIVIFFLASWMRRLESAVVLEYPGK